MLEGVLFDLDGTLIDTAPDFVIAVNTLRNHHGLTDLPAKQITEQVSNGSIALTRQAFAIDTEHRDFDALRQSVLEQYKSYLGSASTVYDQLDLLLIELDRVGIPWGIVTNKPEAYAKPLIKKHQLDRRCSVLVCPEQVTRPKPHPEALLLAAETMRREPENTVYIGDHLRDIEAGNAAGMTTIAAAYGYIDDQQDLQQWQADHIAQSTADLYRLVLELIEQAGRAAKP